MIIENFAASISSYNVRRIQEHAFRTTVTIAKDIMLVLERKNEKFTLEIVDNARNSWHTVDELEFTSEDDIINSLHSHLYAICGGTAQRYPKQEV